MTSTKKAVFQHLILASSSPRRKQLLSMLTPHVQVIVPKLVESYPAQGTASLIARQWAEKKAHNVQNQTQPHHPNAFILAADTILARHHIIYTNPQDQSQAEQMLASLDGKRFTLTTAVCVINAQQKVFLTHQITRLTCARLGRTIRTEYITSGCWRGKAGGIDLDGSAAIFIRSMRGLWSNALGLPLWHTRQLLMTAGMNATALKHPFDDRHQKHFAINKDNNDLTKPR